MNWLDKVAFRQVFGGALMSVGFFHAFWLTRGTRELSPSGLWLSIVLIAGGALVWDTRSAIEFLNAIGRAVPTPWRKSNPNDAEDPPA